MKNNLCNLSTLLLEILLCHLVPFSYQQKSQECTETSPYPGWKNLIDKLFYAPGYERIILEKDSLHGRNCSIDLYQKYSPMHFMSKEAHDPKRPNFKEVLDRVKNIKEFQMWAKYNNITSNKTDPKVKDMHSTWKSLLTGVKDKKELYPGRLLEEQICFSGEEMEALECLSDKNICGCLQEGRFEKMKFKKARQIHTINESLVHGSITCLSGFCGYCKRNSLTCRWGGRCVSFGVKKRWPFNCISGTCRDEGFSNYRTEDDFSDSINSGSSNRVSYISSRSFDRLHYLQSCILCIVVMCLGYITSK